MMSLWKHKRRVTVPNKTYCWLTAFMKSRKVCWTAQDVRHITCWNRRVAWAILQMAVEDDSCQKRFWSCQWMWLFRWPNQVRMRWAGYVACMGQRRCVCWIFCFNRRIDKSSITDFNTKLSYEVWEDIFAENDVNTIFNGFLNTYLRIYFYGETRGKESTCYT